MRPSRALIALTLLVPVNLSSAPRQSPEFKPPKATQAANQESADLQRTREVFARIPRVLARNFKAFDGPEGAVRGFGAGEAYPQIWLRDSSWIVDAAAAYYPQEALTSWLDLHLAHPEEGGRLRDWVAKGSAAAFREWAPRAQAIGSVAFDTNTNESDQESSAALALCRMETLLGGQNRSSDRSRAVRLERSVAAMEALLRDRTDKNTGLIWSGLTADWGDVSPVHPDQRAIYLDAGTPRTLSLYTNVMAYAALDCLGSLPGPKLSRDRLTTRAAALRRQIRASFWIRSQGYFRIRRTLDAVPRGFGEDDGRRFALGGNALAALFGVADEAQSSAIFAAAERLRAGAGFTTVSTVLVPPYGLGVFQHPAMREPFQYQNGGQWDWFGAALVQAEFERGHSEQARRHLSQIMNRIVRAGPGLHEWYGQDGSPKGSGAYAASAAAIYNAVVKGLLGVSRSSAGYEVVVRTGETLLPFEVPQRAIGGRLSVSQRVEDARIAVEVSGAFPVAEVCTILPPGRGAHDAAEPDRASPQSLRKVGADTLMCADVSRSASPIRVNFAVRRRAPWSTKQP